jgi:ABC-type phosphate transport system substrate-binding protein
MKSKLGLLGVLVICLAGAFATSGVVAGSASALCMRVRQGEPSSWKKQNASNLKCEEAETGGGWVEVETKEVAEVTGEPGVFCYKVKAGEPSSFEDSACTKAKSSGGFIKVVGCKKHPKIEGQGSSLQKFAQVSLWIPESGCNVEYLSTGSGSGRTVWGAEEAKSVKKPSTSGDTFIGTDEPLSIEQMEHIDEQAGGKYSKENEKKEGQTIVIPVLQAAVAVIVNMPKKCKLVAITNKNLAEVWDGTITEWSQITGKTGGVGGVEEEVANACKKKISRVVRQDVSGTTFVFKSYLAEILRKEKEKVIEEEKQCNGKTWKEMDTPKENKTWPERGKGGCPETLSPLVEAKNTGGGGEVEEVIKEEGTKNLKEGDIGYANLADARAKFKQAEEETRNYRWLKIENQKGPKFEFPGTSVVEPSAEKSQSNCEGTKYGKKPTKATIDDNWSEVSGAHTGGNAEKNEHYPICTLTYDVALAEYSEAGYGAKAKEEGEATQEYFQFVDGPGQIHLGGNDYLKVEEAVEKLAVEEDRLIQTKR